MKPHKQNIVLCGEHLSYIGWIYNIHFYSEHIKLYFYVADWQAVLFDWVEWASVYFAKSCWHGWTLVMWIVTVKIQREILDFKCLLVSAPVKGAFFPFTTLLSQIWLCRLPKELVVWMPLFPHFPGGRSDAHQQALNAPNPLPFSSSLL